MQVGVDVTYMHTNFGGCDPSGSEIIIATFKNDIQPMDYSPF